jgi:hypothetical protein
MRRKVFHLSVLVLVCAFSTAAQSVHESESALEIKGGAARVALAVEGKAAKVPVELILLDTAGATRASLTRAVQLRQGKHKYKFGLLLPDIVKNAAGEDLAWWRLRYRVGDATGIVSLSELISLDFELRAAAFARIVPGESMRVRVRALDPVTRRTVKGVSIAAELRLPLDTESDDDELVLKRNARTSDSGFVTIDFPIPTGQKFDGDPEILITGQKNGVVRTIEEDLDDESFTATVLLTADKPLYQPGQTFNVRALMLDANHIVMADEELEFSIEDDDDTVVYRQTVKTSAFGIASISWPLPDNAKLGSYRVIVESDDDLYGDRLEFKVSRYDLPNFTVSTKADKPYYLPSDKRADVTITADYLFGKPVPNGKIRVVRDAERRWNPSTQSYEDAGQPAIEGTADAQGRFVAPLDLEEDLADLSASRWRRFEDLKFAAYYTDPATNRTEQRRFDIRLTKEPIHIYFMRYANQHRELPLTAYISTFYADGTPAECNVDIAIGDRRTAARLKTNSLGGGKVEFDIPRDPLHGSRYEISVKARDKKGNNGTFDEHVYMDETPAVRVHTDKTIYKPGDTVEVEVISTKPSAVLYLDVVKEWTPVESRTLRLEDGRARVAIPYKPSFEGELFISVYSDEVEDRWSDEMRTVRGIVFPTPQHLFVDARFEKETYRPGESAKVSFSVRDGSRRPVESALGVSIFDRAIEERARTEADFGEGLVARYFRYLERDRSFGAITLKDINGLDMSRAVPDEMQLAAEIMLAANWYVPSIYRSGQARSQAGAVFGESAKKQIRPIGDALNAEFAKTFDHPTDQASLERILAAAGIDFPQVLDPWGQRYMGTFKINRTQRIVTISSAGPDKKAGTGDDFEAWSSGFDYFTKTGKAIDEAVLSYHARTNRYIRDPSTLVAELAGLGVDLSQLKDPWGLDYRFIFEVSGRNYVTRVISSGPQGLVEVWKNSIDYFAEREREINRILASAVNIKGEPFPRTVTEFSEMLRDGGFDLSTVTDGHGNPVYLVSSTEGLIAAGGKSNGTVTEMVSFKIRSFGADGVMNIDDEDLASFSDAITRGSMGKTTVAAYTTRPYSGAKGAIKGTVADENGAVVPNAEVVAEDESDSSKRFSTRTDDSGEFIFADLTSGSYMVTVPATHGFSERRYARVAVRSQMLTEVKIVLTTSVNSTVDVTANSFGLDLAATTSSSTVTTSTVKGMKVGPVLKEEISTPRLREYFPETLVWRPEVITDKNGKAEVSFKMADNITTWKMFALASDKRGKVGLVEKEVTAFQPFFVDLDPPKFLTEGDDIFLPAQVRNYSDERQRVDVTMDPAGWFAFLTPTKQRIDVTSGASQNAVFGFKATAPADAGKQRVTAVGETESDAIEKPVTVRPNGEEVVRTETRLFEGSTSFDLNYPANALANTQRAELRLYPDLFDHVSESVEGLLQRPYGCGEQTISSTYPNLMIMKFVKEPSPLRERAQRFLRKGYERLLGYQVADGGFSYWGGKDRSNIALTAYALRFLNDAREFIDVDDNAVARAEAWLIGKQAQDGTWTRTSYWGSQETDKTEMTAYVARILAVSRSAKMSSQSNAALEKALAHLRAQSAKMNEPYTMAQFGLASLDAGDRETALRLAERLASMAVAEGPGVYWRLNSDTPFFGWGLTGQIETTALVLQLLTRLASPTDLASRASLYLLRNKDRYGVWHSTQATINVLDAFLAAIPADRTSHPQTLTVVVNGIRLPDIVVPAGENERVSIDLKDKIGPAANTIEVRSSTNSQVMAQVVATHYIDWRDSVPSSSAAVRLDYKCDKANVVIMEEVSCSVATERTGGYGMLLAEIGTPPGADVSRESLEKALETDWSLSRYEVLPDRIVVYMWSRPGGTKFNFRFKPRYGINAQTPASVVYDYYNPEARATVAPLRFMAK